jgi:hypothetical protein
VAHVVKLIDQNNQICLEVHVPSEKLRESIELFQQLHPGARLSIDDAIVQLAGASASPTSLGVTPSGGEQSDPMLAQMRSMLQLNAMLFAEHMERQRLLTDDMVHQYRQVRESLQEVDLMARGARVIEFQEVLRGIQTMNAGPRTGSAEERRGWRSEQLERFFIGGLKATKII